MRLSALISSLGLSAVAIALAGCNLGVPPSSVTAPVAGVALQGKVHGGQQPIVGAAMQLWAAGTTDPSGNVTTPSALLLGPVFTDASGSFSITNKYNCPSAGTQVYITARGGNAGGGANSQTVLMSILGSCGSLTPSTFIFINEETTVIAAEVVLGSTDGTFDANDNITGAQLDNAVSLTAAFSEALEFVDPSTGVVPGPAAPGGPQTYVPGINTLADVLAACVNTGGGLSGDNTPCGNLFAETTYPGGTNPTTNRTVPAGPTPTDTLQAMVNYVIYTVKNSELDLSYGTNLYMLITANPPYVPYLQGTPPLLFPPGVSMFEATATGDGVVHIPFSSQGSGAFALAVGDTTSAAGTNLFLSTSDVAGTPVSATICQTNPNNGQCLGAPVPSFQFVTDSGGNYSFAVFVTASAPIPSSPFYVNLTDSNGNLLDSVSVTLTTN